MEQSGRPGHRRRHTKAVTAHLARTAGPIPSIRQMMREERTRAEAAIQLAAVRAGVDRASCPVLEEHRESCRQSAAIDGPAGADRRRPRETPDRFIR